MSLNFMSKTFEQDGIAKKNHQHMEQKYSEWTKPILV